LCRAFVAFGLCQLQQLVGAGQAFIEAADAVDDLVELRALLAELLRALGLVPNVGVFELTTDFFETFLLRLVVKDTP